MRKLVASAIFGLMIMMPVPPLAAAGRTCSTNDPHTCAVGNQGFDLSDKICGFPISVAVVSDKEYVIHDTFVGGTAIQRVTGRLVLSFTSNPGTASAKTIIENVSGPQTTITYPATITNPEGSGTFEGQGNSYLIFGPHGQFNTHEPGLVFTSGHVVVGFTGPVATSFSLDGTQQNGCALLS